MDRLTRAAPILTLIRNHEAPASAAAKQGVPSQYDVVWSGIGKGVRPARLSAMTVADVIEWQRRVVNEGSASSAAGAYQIIRKTLIGLGLPGTVLFDRACQDAAALKLLDRRGWARVEAGQMTPEDFGNQLAREWASFPVLCDQQGQSRPVKRGQSYYAGDGLNAAYVKPDDVEAAIHAALSPVIAPLPAHEPPAEMSLWAALAQFAAAIFGRKA